MAVTRGSVAVQELETSARSRRTRGWRLWELGWLTVAALIVSAAWWLTSQAKLLRALSPAPVITLSRADNPAKLLPALTVFPGVGDRAFAAKTIFDAMEEREGGFSSVITLSHLRISRAESIANESLDLFRRRAQDANTAAFLPFTPAEFAQMKPQFALRTPDDFRRQALLWAGLILAAFLLVHIVWSVRGFTGSQSCLPLLLLLPGLGFALMIGLRDPLRDVMIFVPYAQGVAGGCLVLLAASLVDWEARAAAFSFVPLLGAIAGSVALILFGKGPAGSDARVNLGPVQPVEAIKILLVFFLAGYFARRWPLLRQLREKRSLLARLVPAVNLPAFAYAAPVIVGVAAALLFFYLQKDLGPALVFAGVFLSLYAIARNRAPLALFGLAALLSGFFYGYLHGTPKTVHDRVAMWLSPWSNLVRGGDQVAHSLWAMSSGGWAGMGPGLGETDVIPAGYTDLIVSALGEEWGFLGIVAVAAIYALLIWTGLNIARRARSDYAFFLALGLTLLVSGELLLVTCGILGLVPLSGVATPFLSYGRTAMLANFFIFGILLSLDCRRKGRELASAARTAPFHSGLRLVEISLALVGLAVVGKAALVQIGSADIVAGQGTLVLQADGGRRFVYNPRLLAAARTLQRGAIYDRTGLPLATSSWEELEKHRDEYRALGIDIDQAASRAESRHYPLGSATFHLLGDLRTRVNWSAPNSSLIERDSAVRLEGYDDHGSVVEVPDAAGRPFKTIRYDYRELLPLLRHRWEPNNPTVHRIRERERNVHLSISAALEMEASRILTARLAQLHLTRGSVVVMDPYTGDLLASVNAPAPDLTAERLAATEGSGVLLDRARYGLYPPGSTFKIVTAIAAMRLNPSLAGLNYQCIRLPDGRTGNYVGNSRRPVRDDQQDHSAHGRLDMHRAIALSCNAYFAQLGTYEVGPENLLDTAKRVGISVADPATVANLKPQMAQASYGQGQVVVTPFQMARVASTVAAGGDLPAGRWITDDSNTRAQRPEALLKPELAAILGKDMRSVVLNGTGRILAAVKPAIAGKTGTAELAGAPSHAWFIGFAPYDDDSHRIAFSVLVENGRYGAASAAPIAGEIAVAAEKLHLIP